MYIEVVHRLDSVFVHGMFQLQAVHAVVLLDNRSQPLQGGPMLGVLPLLVAGVHDLAETKS